MGEREKRAHSLQTVSLSLKNANTHKKKRKLKRNTFTSSLYDQKTMYFSDVGGIYHIQKRKILSTLECLNLVQVLCLNEKSTSTEQKKNDNIYV